MTFFRCSQFRILATLFLAAILSHSGLAEGDALKARPVKTWPKKAFDAPQIWTFFGEEFFPREKPSEDAAKHSNALESGQKLSIVLKHFDDEGAAWLGWGGDGDRQWVPEALCGRAAPENVAEGNIPIGREAVDRWRALPLDYKASDMEPFPEKQRYIDERPCLLRAEARENAIAMLQSARTEKLDIFVLSAFRSADKQRSIYLKKIRAAGYGQQTVAKPGHSEHQLGTAIDVAGTSEADMLNQSFGKSAEGIWIARNAARFGFVASYTEENKHLTGYSPEPWHLRYVGVERAAKWRPPGPPRE